ncbi:cupin domain-containing protein, partial [Actinocorallia lasiicapitis]
MWVGELESWRAGQRGRQVWDDAEALRVADGFAAGQVVVWDEESVRFARRGPDGRHRALVERPRVAEALELLPHPEGGWYRRTWRTAPVVRPEGYPGERPTATGIYFLLAPGEWSMWHVVRSDEVWFWHRGGPLTLLLAGAGATPGEVTAVVLGPDVER